MLRNNATQLERTVHVVQFPHLVNRGHCTGGAFERGWSRRSYLGADPSPDGTPKHQFSYTAAVGRCLRLSRGVIRVVVKDRSRDDLSVLQERVRRHVEIERRKYRELFQFAPACYLQTDVHDRITDVNLAASRLLRVEQQRLIGRSLINFVPQATRKAFRVQLALLRDGQEVHSVHTQLQPRESDPIPVVIDVVPARNDSEIVAYLWLISQW